MSTVSSFIQSNGISSTPKQIDGIWFYTDDNGTLFISDANMTNSTSSYLLGIPSNYSGNSLVFFSSGDGYHIDNLTQVNNYSYNSSWHPNGRLDQQTFVDYLMHENDGSMAAVTRVSWEYAGSGRGETAALAKAVNYIQSNLGININNATYSGFSDGGMEAALLPRAFGLENAKTRLVFFDTNNFAYMDRADLDYVQANVDDFDIVFYKPTWNSKRNLEEFLYRKIPFTMIAGEGADHAIYNYFGANGTVNLFDSNLTASSLANFKNGVDGRNPYGKLTAYRVTYDENGKAIWTEIPYDEAIYKFGSTVQEYVSKINFADFKERIDNLSKYLFTAEDFGGEKKLSSDQKQALNLMNSIRSAVTSQESLSAIANGFAVDSTTKVPTTERDYVAKYFELKLRILEKIINETVSVLETAFDIDLEDKKLALEWEKIPEPEPIDAPNNNGESGGGGGYYYAPHANNNFTSVKVEDKSTQDTNDDIYDEFLPYDEVVTTDNRYVEDKNDYKMLVYHDDDKVLGIEYYYDFGSLEKANEMFSSLNEKYKSMDGFDKLIQNGQYIKVTFNPEYVCKLSLADAIKQYGGSNETI